MANVLAAFVQYLVTAIIFVAVAIAGVICGKKLRENKIAKD